MKKPRVVIQKNGEQYLAGRGWRVRWVTNIHEARVFPSAGYARYWAPRVFHPEGTARCVPVEVQMRPLEAWELV
jgi:hypothetical protein